MGESDWDELRRAHDRGDVREDPPGRWVFPDGTLWFQDGLENREGGVAGIAVFGVATVGCLFATVLALHDGFSWWPWTLGAAALCALGVGRFATRHGRHLDELKKTLDLGVFFCPTEVVLCKGPKQHIPRSRVTGFCYRFHGGDGGSGVRYVHLELGEGQEVATDIRESPQVVAMLRAWHEAELKDRTSTGAALSPREGF